MSVPSPKAWLLAYLRERAAAIALVLLLALVSTALAVLAPWFTKQIIDDGLIARDANALLFWVSVMLALAVAGAALGAANRRAYLSVSSDMLMAMRRDTFAHLATLSPAFYLDKTQGQILTRLDGDIGEVQRFALDSLLGGVNAVLALIGVLIMMTVLSPALLIIAFVLLPVSILFLKLMRPRLESQTRALRERVSDVSTLMLDRLPNMRLLQSFWSTGATLDSLDVLQQRYRDQLLRSQMLGYWVATVPSLFNTLGTAAVFIAGGLMVINGQVTLGTLIAFSAYLTRATGPVNSLLGLFVATQRAKVSLSRVREILDQPAAVGDPADPLPLTDGNGQLRFAQMQFGHDPDAALWESFDATIPGGSRVWISGESGAGKSTLLNLLQRHQDPVSGHIQLDGIRLDRLTLRALRSAIALLDQDAPMLDAPVRDNLTLGLTLDDARLMQALQQVNLTAWLNTLTDGLDTRIGHRGTRMSGGERHRLALARVLLRQPRLILFDETTSAMDPALSQSIWSQVDRLFPTQTLLLVSHNKPDMPKLSHELRLHRHRWKLTAL